MDEVLRESLTVVCGAIGAEALPVADVVMVERWTTLPGFTVERLQQIVAHKGGRKISSARYFEGAVLEAFQHHAVSVPARPKLRSELPWREYLAAWSLTYGCPDDRTTEDLRWGWEVQRVVLGLPIGDDDEIPDCDDGVSAGEPLSPPLPLAA